MCGGIAAIRRVLPPPGRRRHIDLQAPRPTRSIMCYFAAFVVIMLVYHTLSDGDFSFLMVRRPRGAVVRVRATCRRPFAPHRPPTACLWAHAAAALPADAW